MALAWLLQRVTGAILVLFLGTHLWLLHYVLLGERITFERVQARLQSPLFLALDLAILAAGIYHALYGIRGIILDFGVRSGRPLTWGLAVIGLLGFGLGTYGLLSYLR